MIIDQSEINNVNFIVNNIHDPKCSISHDKIIFVSQNVQSLRSDSKRCDSLEYY